MTCRPLLNMAGRARRFQRRVTDWELSAGLNATDQRFAGEGHVYSVFFRQKISCPARISTRSSARVLKVAADLYTEADVPGDISPSDIRPSDIRQAILGRQELLPAYHGTSAIPAGIQLLLTMTPRERPGSVQVNGSWPRHHLCS